MTAKPSLFKRLQQFWICADLGLIHNRRERRMRILASLVMLIMGVIWAVFFALRGAWGMVVMDMVLILSGLTVFTLTWRQHVRSANLVLFSVLLVIISGMAAILDVPNATAPRATHLYLLPLGVAALMAFSQKQFCQSGFVAEVLALITRYEIDASRLQLELTETMVVDDMEDLTRKMSMLVEHGVTFALDDFGTGYSSLSHLKRLPLSKLKIDQSFVFDALTDANSETIIRTVIALGQSMGLSVIAEGVETQAQQQFLLNSGCLQFQGYLLSRPLPLEAFSAFTQAHNS